MKLYRLKDEVKQYIESKHHDKELSSTEWLVIGLSHKALEEVKPKRVEVKVDSILLDSGDAYRVPTQDEIDIVELALNELGGSEDKLNELFKHYFNEQYYEIQNNPNYLYVDFTDWLKQNTN